jgi:cytochrome c-type biogenesis protein CcmH/NrfG
MDLKQRFTEGKNIKKTIQKLQQMIDLLPKGKQRSTLLKKIIKLKLNDRTN